jgi:hypothetical protein
MHVFDGVTWLTVAEAADLLGTTPGALHTQRWRGSSAAPVPSIRLGHAVFYRERDCRDYLARRDMR